MAETIIDPEQDPVQKRKFERPLFNFHHANSKDFSYDVFFDHPKEVGDYRGLKNQTYRTSVCTIRSRHRMQNGIVAKQTIASAKIKWPLQMGPTTSRAKARKIVLRDALHVLFPQPTAKHMRSLAWRAYFEARKAALTPPPPVSSTDPSPALLAATAIIKAEDEKVTVPIGGHSVVNKEVRGKLLHFPIQPNPHTGWPHGSFYVQGNATLH